MSNDPFSRSLLHALDKAGTVRVRTALNPILWLTAVVTPTSFFAAWLAGFDTTIGACLVGLGASPVLVAVASFVWFALQDPDRLQSEEYLLRQREIHILSKSGEVLVSSETGGLEPNPLLTPSGKTQSGSRQ